MDIKIWDAMEFAWPEGPLTREQFIAAWCDARDIPKSDRRPDGCVRGGERRYAVACNGECGFAKCQGWVMVDADSAERKLIPDTNLQREAIWPN